MSDFGCEAYWHFPCGGMHSPRAMELMEAMGIDFHHPCEQSPDLYVHISLPDGWEITSWELPTPHLHIKDARGRPRVDIGPFATDPSGDILEVTCRRFYEFFMAVDPRTAKVTYAARSANGIFTLVHTVRQPYPRGSLEQLVYKHCLKERLFKRLRERYPHADNPLAYWDD